MIYTVYLILTLVVFIGFWVSYFAQKATLELASKFNIYDDFNSRKIRKSPRPRLGGVGIFAGFMTSFYLLFFVVYLLTDERYRDWIEFSIFSIMLYICSMIFFFLLGLYDDFKGLKAFQKLGVELVIATILFFIGFKIELLTLPFVSESINVGAFSYPLTILWIIGISNAINLIDGLDGLAGGVIAIASITIIIICVQNRMIFPAVIISCLLGGTLGFLPYNIFPSKILMGDSGSLFAGTVLATISLKTAHKASLGISLIIPIIFLAIPVMDTVLSFFRRLMKRQNPFKGDDDHIHHRLMRKGFSEKKSANILLSLTAIFSVLSILVSYYQGTLRFIALFLSVILGMLLMTYLNYIGFRLRRKGNGIQTTSDTNITPLQSNGVSEPSEKPDKNVNENDEW